MTLEERVAALERRERALLGLLHDYLSGRGPANAVAAGVLVVWDIAEEQHQLLAEEGVVDL